MFQKDYLHTNEGFSQVVVIETEETKTLYISGQIGEGNDLETQTIATFKNLETLLKECNSSFQDVVKTNTYIVNFNPEVDLPIFRKVRKTFLGSENYPASTLVGVSVLGNRNWLIEIEATAVIDKKAV
ncbi:RidA family protein [Flavobacterium terrigena]|uniref:Enamine deaminase RidA, house cleaning of reactive enamine intermediates, YjgF/YER057c/UK114 family n=1 Tax=Flavobacterium terrigena TaxID=402734 RepID=A0A1H6SDS3_9FLAO|nr:RidA family protein [Flavobacterium terrigena]SEI61905.1 Enamine deaminase RidA, house cleaning of reactive enamine intermediates, YjgF/YER057c/UK114 family [Flavobacterium terrigena]